MMPTVKQLAERLAELEARIVEIERTLFNRVWEKQKEVTLKHLNKDKK